MGDLVCEGPDALVSTEHLQAGKELGQLLVAPGVVPEGTRGAGNGHCPHGDTATPTWLHLPMVVGGEDGPEHHVLLPDDLQQLKGTQSSGEGPEEVTQTHCGRGRTWPTWHWAEEVTYKHCGRDRTCLVRHWAEESPKTTGQGWDKGVTLSGAGGWGHADPTGMVAFMAGAFLGKAQSRARGHCHKHGHGGRATHPGHSQAHTALPTPARLPGGSERQLNLQGQEQILGCSRSSEGKEMPKSAPNAQNPRLQAERVAQGDTGHRDTGGHGRWKTGLGTGAPLQRGVWDYFSSLWGPKGAGCGTDRERLREPGSPHGPAQGGPHSAPHRDGGSVPPGDAPGVQGHSGVRPPPPPGTRHPPGGPAHPFGGPLTLLGTAASTATASRVLSSITRYM